MSSWDGNNYNRAKELPKFLAQLDTEALAKFGQKKKSRNYMTNYNYTSHDKDLLAERNNAQAIPTNRYTIKANPILWYHDIEIERHK